MSELTQDAAARAVALMHEEVARLDSAADWCEAHDSRWMAREARERADAATLGLSCVRALAWWQAHPECEVSSFGGGNVDGFRLPATWLVSLNAGTIGVGPTPLAALLAAMEPTDG